MNKRVIVILVAIIIGTPIGLYTDLNNGLIPIISFLVSGILLFILTYFQGAKKNKLVNNLGGFLILISTTLLIFYFINNRWTNDKLSIEVNECIKATGIINEKYPIQAKEYCECSIYNISKNISYYKYLESSEQFNDSVDKYIKGLFAPCLIVLESQIDSIKNTPSPSHL